MCTTIKYKNCMGRNFDYEISYNETIKLWNKEKYKMCGVVTGIVKEFPLYYDAMNEYGLCIAGLNFEGNAYYNDEIKDKNNIASWELPVKILGNCKNIDEVKKFMQNVNITKKPYNDEMLVSELHWFVCDENSSIVIEQTEDEGLRIFNNPYGILTNNPPFDKMQKAIETGKSMFKKSNYVFRKILPKKYKTRGLETYGLLGDLTSISRFERINFYKDRLNNTNDKFNNVVQTFHLLNSVEQIYGATPINNKFEYTIYEVVYDMENKTINYKKYDTMEVKKIDFGAMLNIEELKW